MRIALIADSHLSARSPECVANWHAASRAVQRLAPDVSVHLGDITLDGQTRPEELAFAQQLMAGWPTELYCIPGNHDMGDGSGEAPLDARLLAGYREVFGPDYWTLAANGWQVLAINAQLLGTGTPQEAEQWQWIEVQAQALDAASRVALLLHRPLARLRPGERSRRGRYVDDAASERLLNGPLAERLRLVVSGHTHQYLDLVADGVRHLWMPSSAFVLPDEMQARVGEKLVGLGLLDLDGDRMSFDLWCPDGMLRHDLTTLPVYAELAAHAVRADG